MVVLANMADNNNDDDLRRLMETQKQTFRTQQEVLDNNQRMLAQLLKNWNNNDTIGSNHNEEENMNNDPPMTERSKEGSSIDVKVIKSIQAQIASLAQRDCNAPILRVRRRYCDVYIHDENILTYIR